MKLSVQCGPRTGLGDERRIQCRQKAGLLSTLTRVSRLNNTQDSQNRGLVQILVIFLQNPWPQPSVMWGNVCGSLRKEPPVVTSDLVNSTQPTTYAVKSVSPWFFCLFSHFHPSSNLLSWAVVGGKRGQALEGLLIVPW